MSLITQKNTAAPVYTRVRAAQAALRAAYATNRGETLVQSVYAFEDVINGASGEVLNLPADQILAIRNENSDLVAIGVSMGVRVSLHGSMLPTDTEAVGTVVTEIAKQLYPLTTSVSYVYVEDPSYVAPNTTLTTTAPDGTNVVYTTPLTDAQEDVLEETVDTIFDALDAEETTEEPLSTIQTETAPYLSNSLIEIALTAAEYEPLQAGLVEFSQNPLADLIDDTRALLLYYTEGNYANLNTALSTVNSNPSLSAEWESFKETLGGPDGLSGCVVQLDIFKEHTDRLSGLNLDSASPNDETDNDSTSEYLNLNDYSGGPQVLFSFDARRFRSAKYLIQASAANTSRGHQATEIYILHDNHHAYTREITSIYSNEPFCTFTTRLLNANVEVLANTSAPNTDFVISGTRLRIARQANAYGEISQNKIIEQHETLASYLNDGVDYVELQSASLLKGYLVANLARDFRDALAVLRDPQWLSQSTALMQAGITNFVNTLKTRRTEIQESIDTDYSNFVACRKKAEALDIAYNLTVAYTDENGNSIPSVTLNTATITAIEESE